MLHRLNRVVVWAPLVVIASLVVCWPVAAQAKIIRLANGHAAGVQLRDGVGAPGTPSPFASPFASGASTSGGTLLYNGGPVLHSTAPYLVFWDPSAGISASSESLMERYLADTSTGGTENSDVYGVVRQYHDANGYAGASQAFSTSSQAFVDTQAYPAEDTVNCELATGYTSCVTDSQVQAELTRLIASKGWPTGTGANAPVYFVVLPQSTNECIDGQAYTCMSNYFCAYHSNYSDGSAQVLYSILGFGVFNFGPKGCQSDNTSAYQSPNSDQADNVIDNLDHEYNETITDPFGTSWYSQYGEEIADNCQAVDPASPSLVDPTSTSGGPFDPNAYLPTLGGSAASGTLYDQLINAHQYYTQTVWSNGENDCKTEPTSVTLTPAFTAPADAGTGDSVSFDPTSSVAAAGVSSVTWDFGDGSTAFASGSPLVRTHVYSSTGQKTVTLTIVDANGNVSSVSHTIQIVVPPTASFTAAGSAPVDQPVAFDGSGSSDPTAGSSIASYAWNFGDGTAPVTSTTAVTHHTYSLPGTYTVTLTVTGTDGVASAPASRTVAVTVQPPSASLAVAGSPALIGHSISFSGAGSTDPNAGGSISSYAWSFGDGATATGATASHAYAGPGIYTVTLRVVDSYGQAATATKTVAVVPPGRITSVRLRSKKHHREFVVVTVTQAGTVSVGKAHATLQHAGTVTLKLALTKAQSSRLNAHHRVNVRITVTYRPAFGPTVRTTKKFAIKP